MVLAKPRESATSKAGTYNATAMSPNERPLYPLLQAAQLEAFLFGGGHSVFDAADHEDDDEGADVGPGSIAEMLRMQTTAGATDDAAATDEPPLFYEDRGGRDEGKPWCCDKCKGQPSTIYNNCYTKHAQTLTEFLLQGMLSSCSSHVLNLLFATYSKHFYVLERYNLLVLICDLSSDLSAVNAGAAGASSSAAGAAQPHARRAVWEDPADSDIRVNVADKARLRKLRKEENQRQLNGRQYESALRQQHQQLNPRTGWADRAKQVEQSLNIPYNIRCRKNLEHHHLSVKWLGISSHLHVQKQPLDLI